MQSGSVFLIRHGQAGLRQNYDELSEVGIEQAHQLGAYWRAQGVDFASVIVGGLARQQETARIVASYLDNPRIDVDPSWSEFDLDEVYRGVAEPLARHDAQFAREYAALQEEMLRAASHVHREWTACDVAVFRAWLEERFPFEGETFVGFCERIRSARQSLFLRPKPSAVFTSATPIGLIFGWARGLGDEGALREAGMIWNCAITEMEVAGDVLRGVMLNEVPHLGKRLLTKR